MEARGDALFPRRYLDEFEKRISELHRCAERAREKAAGATHQAVGLLLDAADAHEQAAMAYELAGGNGHIEDFQARAGRHRKDAAARRATAAALIAGIRDRRDRDDLQLQEAGLGSDPLGRPGEPDARTGQRWEPGANCELPPDRTHRPVGPWQAVLPLFTEPTVTGQRPAAHQ